MSDRIDGVSLGTREIDDVTPRVTLPTDAQQRKAVPIVRGVLDYFPAAIAEIARVSKAGNDQHNPGQEMHHARGKSNDHADCIVRHLMDRGTVDTDGMRHSAKVAWRALALLQEELEAAGAPLARGARLPDSERYAYEPAQPGVVVTIAGIPGKHVLGDPVFSFNPKLPGQ